MFEQIKKWYNMNLWTIGMVEMAVVKHVITEEECQQILNNQM